MDDNKAKLTAYLPSLESILFVLTMVAYAFFSLYLLRDRISNFDEVNAWNIAQNCSITDLFDVTRREGHFMLWYLLLKPFAATNFLFPVSMYALNWVFAFSAVFLLWKKAPLNPWLKVFITFSLAIQMHTVYARCYAIGILVLFIICSIYPQRKSRPVLYPFLIILLANTSIIACLAAFALGLIYCCEAFLDLRNKKITLRSLIKPFIVFSLGSIVILAQMINPQIPFYVNDMEQLFGSFRYEVLQMSDYWPRNISLILFALLLIGSFWFFREDKKPCYFLLISTALLILVALTVYTLHIWHYLLLFVFFVSAMWIYLQENKIKTLYQKIYYGLFILLSFCCIFFARYPWIWNGFHMSTAKYLKVHQEEYKGAKIFLYPVDSSIIGIVPLFKDSDIDFYGPRGTSYNSCETYVHQWDPERIDFSAIRQVWLNNLKQLNKSFIFVSTAEPWKNDLQDFLTAYQKDNGGIKIYEYAGTNDVRIFKIY